MPAPVLILSDAPVEGDGRVTQCIEAYEHAGFHTTYLNIKACQHKAGLFSYAVAVLHFFLLVLPIASRRLPDFLSASSRYGAFRYLGAFFTALPTAFRETFGYYTMGHAARKHYPLSAGNLLHAHDLGALIFAYGLAGSTKCEIIYDAHEMNLYRDRKMGLFRLLLNYCYEAAIVPRTIFLVTVNNPIRHFFRKAYKHGNTRVIPNLFFQQNLPISLPDTDTIPTVVFFGAIVKNRGLDALVQSSGENLKVVIVFFGRDTEYAAEIRHKSDKRNVVFLDGRTLTDEILTKHVTAKTWGWCYIEDVCLNNRLALPNKFWQYLSLKIPMLTNQGSYVDKLTHRLGIGRGLRIDGNRNELAQTINNLSDSYDQRIESVRQLRVSRLRASYQQLITELVRYDHRDH